MGSASAPEAMDTNSDAVQDAAKYAAIELSYQLKKAECLPSGHEGFKVDHVHKAVVRTLAGLNLEMLVDLVEVGGSAETKTFQLTVIERCGGAAGCINQLSIPGSSGEPCKL